MIEIWMLFNLLIPFIEVVLHTGRYFLLQKETEEREKSDLDITRVMIVATPKNSVQDLKMFKNKILPTHMESKINRLDYI